jgi:hypothetical protein
MALILGVDGKIANARSPALAMLRACSAAVWFIGFGTPFIGANIYVVSSILSASDTSVPVSLDLFMSNRVMQVIERCVQLAVLAYAPLKLLHARATRTSSASAELVMTIMLPVLSAVNLVSLAYDFALRETAESAEPDLPVWATFLHLQYAYARVMLCATWLDIAASVALEYESSKPTCEDATRGASVPTVSMDKEARAPLLIAKYATIEKLKEQYTSNENSKQQQALPAQTIGEMGPGRLT